MLQKKSVHMKMVHSLRPSDAYMRHWINHHSFRYWLVAWPAPSQYLNQCRNIVNWTLRNKLQWNLNRNSNIFIQENAFASIVCETVAILSRPQCVKLYIEYAYVCGVLWFAYIIVHWELFKFVCPGFLGNHGENGQNRLVQSHDYNKEYVERIHISWYGSSSDSKSTKKDMFEYEMIQWELII